MKNKVFLILAINFCIIIFFTCNSPEQQQEISRLQKRITELEGTISNLREENDRLKITATSQQSTTETNELGNISMSQPSTNTPKPSAPTYYSGEIITSDCIRIPVEMFGRTPNDDWSKAKIVGTYRNQHVEVPWYEILRIWMREWRSTPTLGLDMKDGRYFEVIGDIEPSNTIEYINTDEITHVRSFRSKSLGYIIVITINGKIESMSYCSKCNKYFPDIYKQCNSCGANLTERKTPQ